MSEPIIEYREEFNISDIARNYAERVARVIDEQTLANVEDQLAEYGYVRVVRCRNCRYYNLYQDLCERLQPGMLVLEPDDGFCAWGERRDTE